MLLNTLQRTVNFLLTSGWLIKNAFKILLRVLMYLFVFDVSKDPVQFGDEIMVVLIQ